MEINDDLLISYMLGEASPETDKQVAAWINADPNNKKRYEQFRVIWDKSRSLQYNGDVDARASLQKLKEKAAVQNKRANNVISIAHKSLWIKIAATILVFAACGVFYIYHYTYREIQLATANDVKVDTLSDGSIVTLNKATALKYPVRFSGKKREVMLVEGEAFFHIAKNKAKPFIISTGGTTIRVVGTSFNVKYKANTVEVIVETGIVQVTRNNNTIDLLKGEKVLVQQNSVALKKEKNPDQLYNYYRSKEFIADNTPLWRMVNVLNEAYGSKIVIARNELKNLPLNTTFKDESLDDILAIIGRTFGLEIDKKQGLIVIK